MVLPLMVARMLAGKKTPSCDLSEVRELGWSQLVASGLSPKIERKWQHVG